MESSKQYTKLFLVGLLANQADSPRSANLKRLIKSTQKTIPPQKCSFFVIFGARDWSQRLLQALRFDFPSKMRDLDAYLSSYGHF